MAGTSVSKAKRYGTKAASLASSSSSSSAPSNSSSSSRSYSSSRKSLTRKESRRVKPPKTTKVLLESANENKVLSCDRRMSWHIYNFRGSAQFLILMGIDKLVLTAHVPVAIALKVVGASESRKDRRLNFEELWVVLQITFVIATRTKHYFINNHIKFKCPGSIPAPLSKHWGNFRA